MGGPERHANVGGDGDGHAPDDAGLGNTALDGVDLDEWYPPLIRRPRLAIAVALVVAAALFLGGQVAAGMGAENRCVHRSDSSRYRWHGLEWRWASAPPGVWCTWTDTDTGEIVGAWAWGPLPDEHLESRISDSGG